MAGIGAVLLDDRAERDVLAEVLHARADAAGVHLTQHVHVLAKLIVVIHTSERREGVETPIYVFLALLCFLELALRLVKLVSLDLTPSCLHMLKRSVQQVWNIFISGHLAGYLV